MRFFLHNHQPVHLNPAHSPAQLLLHLNSLLSNLSRSRQSSAALQLFDQIHSSHLLNPDHYTLASSLAACAHLRDARAGWQLHSFALRTGLDGHTHISNALVSLYAKSGDLRSAVQVFDEMLIPDVYSWTSVLSAYVKCGCMGLALQMFDRITDGSSATWNVMITGFAEHGYDEVVFDMFREMHRTGTRHDQFSFATVLSLCCSDNHLNFGKQVHSLVVRTGFVLTRVSVVNALLTMYFNCAMIGDGCDVFREAKIRNHVTFNSMIGGLVKWGRDLDAVIIFKEMQELRFRPSELTFVSVLSGCSSDKMIVIGAQIHGQAVKVGFDASLLVSNSAITMYSCSGNLNSARLVFEKLKDKDIVSWNSMIAGYSQGSYDELAIMLFLLMLRAGVEPDGFTIGSLLSCSGCEKSVETIHSMAIKNGLTSKIQVLNALISAYSTHFKLDEAYQIFQSMSSRNFITWNSIISGCVVNGFPAAGLQLFLEMQRSHVKPNVYSLSLLLSTCASLSDIMHGKQIHAYILRVNVESETSLGNALITLYAKCGLLHWSYRVFEKMSGRDIISWNSVLAAYSQHGRGHDVIDWFNIMKTSGVVPDPVTFTIVLSACSHSGLVDLGLQIFSSMVEDFGIDPSVDQFSCMVDLLGRAGHLNEAETVIDNLSVQTDSRIWWALLSACRVHGNIRLGGIAAKRLLEFEPDNPAVYVLLSNIYADAGQWEEAASVRKLIRENGVMKKPGYSWM